MNEERRPATPCPDVPADTKTNHPQIIHRKLRKNTKTWRVLYGLTQRSFNRFEAARELHDTALNSTVATIGTKYGIRIDRREETVPGFQGNPTRCCRYWISPEQRGAAYKVLGLSGDGEVG